MANRVRDWTAPREALSPLRRGQAEAFPHTCDRRRCLARDEYLNGERHYPHKGAQCHHRGEDPARCPTHGGFLQFYGGREFSNRYPAGVCYACLPDHLAACPMVTLPLGDSCTCPARLARLGQSRHKGARAELRPTG